jgi:hypothetical protein
LLARRIRFTPEGESPPAGAWGGFDLTFSSSATTIDGCTIDHAGAGTSPYAWTPPISGVPAPVVRTPRSGRVVFEDTTFRDDAAPAFSGVNDCGGYEATKLHNASIGQLLCAKSPAAVLAFEMENTLQMLSFGGPSESILGGGASLDSVADLGALDAGPKGPKGPGEGVGAGAGGLTALGGGGVASAGPSTAVKDAGASD